MTASDLWPRFQGHDIFRHWISQKRKEIDPSAIVTIECQQEVICALSNGVTLSDLWPRFQGHGITEGKYLKNGACQGQSFYRTLIGNHTLCKCVVRVCQHSASAELLVIHIIKKIVIEFTCINNKTFIYFTLKINNLASVLISIQAYLP